MNKTIFLSLLGMAFLLTGCTMAPKYDRPAAPVSAQWPHAAAYPAITNAPAVPTLAWRHFFTDAKLQQVIETALNHNRDLRLAALNVERARDLYGIQRAALLPSVNVDAGGVKQRAAADFTSAGNARTTEKYAVNLGVAAWEIDFFGRIRSLKDRALKEYLATEQARRSAQILVVSSVANAYLALAADGEKLALAKTTFESQKGSYDLIQRLAKLGLAPETDLYRAQTQMAAAQRDIAGYLQATALDQNALDLLVGSNVMANLIPATLDSVTPPKEIYPGISSEVLLQRPDVLQSENLLKAANADIGAARATLFPRISLTTTLGTASSELSGLFKSGSDTWLFAPQISMPIFDPRSWSALKASKVQREIALTQYEKAIQTAFREVADALAVRDQMDQQLEAQQTLVHAVAETYRLSNIRYVQGIDNYLGVYEAQRSLFIAQQVQVSLRLAKQVNQVRLYAVLGGGGDQPDTPQAR
jgi:multidrug efflux system outer membrane protein